jgi:hypothetical protein
MDLFYKLLSPVYYFTVLLLKTIDFLYLKYMLECVSDLSVTVFP